MKYDAIIVENVVDAARWVMFPAPAASIIDWELPCPKIGDRPEADDLVENTRNRIWHGGIRHGWWPFTTAGAGNTHERTPGNRSRDRVQPLPTQETSATSALVDPPAFLVQSAHGGRYVPLHGAHPTVCASDDRHGLIVHTRGTSPGQIAATADDVERATRSVTAGGNHQALLLRNNPNNHARHPDEALGTATTSHNRHALLVRHNGTKGDLSWAATPNQEVARTMTTKGQQGVLIPEAGIVRNMSSRGSQASNTRHASQAVQAMTASSRPSLVQPQLDSEKRERDELINECGYRMLEPYEVAAAQAFPTEHTGYGDNYIPRNLTKKDQVALAGNAVPPPMMAFLVDRVRRALEAA